MRRSARPLLAGMVVAALLPACQPAAPVAEKPQPKRRSFEDSNAWQPVAPAAAPASGAAGSNVDAQARQVRQSWEQARQAGSDAERQRAAGEALQKTRAMAEQPSGQ